jgi:hypothetical protein
MIKNLIICFISFLCIGCICSSSNDVQITGTVVKEFGSIMTLPSNVAPLDNNGPVKFKETTYGIILKTDSGNYTLEIDNRVFKPILALEQAIEPGTKVTINVNGFDDIAKDKIGHVRSTHVTVLDD